MLGRFNCVPICSSLWDRDADLGGATVTRPPKILVVTEVVAPGVVWKIKKALYGLFEPHLLLGNRAGQDTQEFDVDL